MSSPSLHPRNKTFKAVIVVVLLEQSVRTLRAASKPWGKKISFLLAALLFIANGVSSAKKEVKIENETMETSLLAPKISVPDLLRIESDMKFDLAAKNLFELRRDRERMDDGVVQLKRKCAAVRADSRVVFDSPEKRVRKVFWEQFAPEAIVGFFVDNADKLTCRE